jgi:hypothetical protein
MQAIIAAKKPLITAVISKNDAVFTKFYLHAYFQTVEIYRQKLPV